MKTIYVFGDSHSCMFDKNNRMTDESKPIFNVFPQAVEYEGFEGFLDMSSGVPLAYSLEKHHDVIMKVLESIIFKPEDEMWFVFGEIDVRFHIFYWHQELEISLDKSIDNVVAHYTAYVKKLREMGYNIHIVSIVPPQPNPLPYHNDPTYEIRNPIRGEGITVADRVYMTEKLNSELQKACSENGIPFRDIHRFIVDPVTRCNIPDMTRDGMHYYYIGDLIVEKLGLMDE